MLFAGRINILFTSLISLLSFSLGSELNQVEPKDTYIGAVVEYKPTGTPWDSTPAELLEKNANIYINLIQEASTHGADIVVFPEYGLTTLGVPRDRDSALPFLQLIPEIGTNPCIENLDKSERFPSSPTIRNLSCAARNSSIYVVVNVGEVQDCRNETRPGAVTNQAIGPCHPDGRHQYNSNVAFDRNGQIVAKYHKHSLYFEEQFEAPPVPMISIFKADFGVDFGLFICFDMMFQEPAVHLVAQGVRNIIYPTAWVDELPFLTAIQSQGIWAAAADVNLLASGYHQPLGGQLGSGIFSGKIGVLNYTFNPDSGTKLILAEIPKIPGNLKLNHSNTDPGNQFPKQYHSFLRENLRNYSTALLDLTSSRNEHKVCHDQLCCSVEYLLATAPKNSTTLTYRLIAFSGFRKVAQETAEFGWELCGVVRCLNSTLESCTENGRSVDSAKFSNFEYLRISGGPFQTGHTMQPALNAMDIYFKQIPFAMFEFETSGEISEIISKDLSNISIQTIGVINRLY